eukprot:Nitzschia sp. Nitz4//scaffold60_size111251//96671//98018//NITZ4_004162-RA/size111251-augustus-gene-0.116-mRNA-1//1//CDS//3329555609//1200//frame0
MMHIVPSLTQTNMNDPYTQFNQSSSDASLISSDSQSFPSKLFQCLSDSEIMGFSDVIGWQPDGTSFKVHNPDRFAAEIMPLYFGAIQFKSWQRQLSFYGFSKVSMGLTRGSYMHNSFRRGERSLALEIQRIGYPKPPTEEETNNDAWSNYLRTPIHTTSALSAITGLPAYKVEYNDGGVFDISNDKREWVSNSPLLQDQGVKPSSWDPSKDIGSISLDLDLDDDDSICPSDIVGGNIDGNLSLPLASDLIKGLAGDSPVDDQPECTPSFTATTTMQTTQPSAASVSSPEQRRFPWKLHDMLTEAEKNGFQDIISWEPDGNAFKVHDCKAFVADVMPLYFDQSRYESFRRQLRKYGFSRLEKDRYRGAYHHKFFQRNNRQLCKFITREAQKLELARGKGK